MLWDLVKQEGLPNTRVVLTGEVPSANEPAMTRRAPSYDERSVYANDDWSNAQPSRRYDSQPRTGYWVRQPAQARRCTTTASGRPIRVGLLPPSPFFFRRVRRAGDGPSTGQTKLLPDC